MSLNHLVEISGATKLNVKLYMNFSVTILILAFTAICSIALMNNLQEKGKWIFHPMTIKKTGQWYRFLSSGFIHGDIPHLAINMFVFWSFGTAIETHYYAQVFGDMAIPYFLGLYFGGIIVASIPSYLRHHDNPRYAALGASGGVSAVVFACIVFAPWQNLYLYAAIPIPQILAGILYLAYSWYQDKNAQDNIGHMAHFSGAIWGFVFTCIMEPRLLSRFIGLTLQGP